MNAKLGWLVKRWSDDDVDYESDWEFVPGSDDPGYFDKKKQIVYFEVENYE